MKTKKMYVYGCQEAVKEVVHQEASKFFCLRHSRQSLSKGTALEAYLRRGSGFTEFKARMIASPLDFDLGLHLKSFTNGGYTAETNPILATEWVLEELRNIYRQAIAKHPTLAQTLTGLGQTSTSPHRVFYALTRDVRSVVEIFSEPLNVGDFVQPLMKTYSTPNFGGDGDAVTTFHEVAPCMMVADEFCAHIQRGLRLCVDTTTPKKHKAWLENKETEKIKDLGDAHHNFTNILNKALVFMNAIARKNHSAW